MPAHRLPAFHTCRHQARLLERRPYALGMPRPVCRRRPLCGTRPRSASLVRGRNHPPGRAGMRQTQQSPHLPHRRGLLACRTLRHLGVIQLVVLLPRCKRFGLALVSRFRALCHRDAARLSNRLRLFLAWQQRGEDPEPASAQRRNGNARGRSRISQQGSTDAIRVEPRQPLQRARASHGARNRLGNQPASAQSIGSTPHSLSRSFARENGREPKKAGRSPAARDAESGEGCVLLRMNLQARASPEEEPVASATAGAVPLDAGSSEPEPATPAPPSSASFDTRAFALSISLIAGRPHAKKTTG